MSRIVVIANRLPVKQTERGEWQTSPGGLVSALAPVLRNREGHWIGWPGVPDLDLRPFAHGGIHQHSVRMSQSEIDDFYVGFCNGTIWPLYHDAIRTTEFHRHWWRPYVAINRRFAEAAAVVVEPGDVVWVQDYHLQLVPGMLRELRPDARIGFYLHTPFPPAEIYARMPWRREILKGLLGADVVAFQTRLGCSNFVRACKRIVGSHGRGTHLDAPDGRQVTVQTAPIAIDAAYYEDIAKQEKVIRRAAEIRQELGSPRRVLLGIDRLDYTKGIDIRLKAFETFLEHHPDRPHDVCFVQIAVPSREAVPEYVKMRQSIEELVGRIDGRFATGGRVPIQYLYRSVSPEELVAYYLAADVMVVTPLRDGMNLIAQEYVACRTGNDGVLMLSEFAGSANILRHALIVNPYDVDGVATTLEEALNMPLAEQRRRIGAMRRQVRRDDVHKWAARCIEAISGARRRRRKRTDAG